MACHSVQKKSNVRIWCFEIQSIAPLRVHVERLLRSVKEKFALTFSYPSQGASISYSPLHVSTPTIRMALWSKNVKRKSDNANCHNKKYTLFTFFFVTFPPFNFKTHKLFFNRWPCSSLLIVRIFYFFLISHDSKQIIFIFWTGIKQIYIVFVLLQHRFIVFLDKTRYSKDISDI